MCQMIFVALLANFIQSSATAVSNVILNQFALQLLTHFTNSSLRSTNQLNYLAWRLLIHYVFGTSAPLGFYALHCPLSFRSCKVSELKPTNFVAHHPSFFPPYVVCLSKNTHTCTCTPKQKKNKTCLKSLNAS